MIFESCRFFFIAPIAPVSKLWSCKIVSSKKGEGNFCKNDRFLLCGKRFTRGQIFLPDLSVCTRTFGSDA